jgi:thioredoxin 1
MSNNSAKLILLVFGTVSIIGGGNLEVTKENKSFVQEIADSAAAQEAINGSGVVVVDFFADWCGPCKEMKPIFEELAEDCKDKYSFKSINFDKVPDIAANYQVTSLPTFIVFKDGKVLDKFLGKQSKEDLLKKIEDAVNLPTDLSELSQEQLNSKFLNAVKNKQPLSSLQELIDAGADINAKGEYNLTALMSVIFTQLPQGVDASEVIEFLIKNGATTKFDAGNGTTMDAIEYLNGFISNMKNTINNIEKAIEVIKDSQPKKKKMVCNGDVCTLQ